MKITLFTLLALLATFSIGDKAQAFGDEDSQVESSGEVLALGPVPHTSCRLLPGAALVYSCASNGQSYTNFTACDLACPSLF